MGLLFAVGYNACRWLTAYKFLSMFVAKSRELYTKGPGKVYVFLTGLNMVTMWRRNFSK